MNVEMMRKVEARIVAEPESFDQTEPYGGCGSPCCLAGHAYAIAMEVTDEETPVAPWSEQSDTARRALGLTKREAAVLFCEHWPEEWLREAGAPPREREPGQERDDGEDGLPLQEDGTYVIPTRGEALKVVDLMCRTGRVPDTPGWKPKPVRQRSGEDGTGPADA